MSLLTRAPSATAQSSRLAGFAPNWFATVMGTGIVANAVATLPVQVPVLLTVARGVWVLDVLLLLVVSVATLGQWVQHRERAVAHLDDPMMAHFYGAPAMALLTVGAGALLLGVPLVGQQVAVAIDGVLWTLGTLLGLGTAVLVPYRSFTTHVVAPDGAFGGWLMPVVPPMVSAATGPLLLAHLPAGEARLDLLIACTAMFGLTLIASLVVITQVWGRLAHHSLGAAVAVPTLWIVLGPLGQSITAAHTIGAAAPGILPPPYGDGFRVLGLVFGLPTWGFAMLWLALVIALTVRTARRGLPFSMTWWSFTFPVGTLVTGTSALAALTGSAALEVAAMALYVALLAAWLVVAARTLRGLRDRTLLPAGG